MIIFLTIIVAALTVAQLHRRNPVARFIARHRTAQAAIIAMSALLVVTAVSDIISHP